MEEGRELGPSDEDSENDHEDNDDSSDGNSSQARPPSAAQPVSSAQNLTAWPYSSSANSKQGNILVICCQSVGVLLITFVCVGIIKRRARLLVAFTSLLSCPLGR